MTHDRRLFMRAAAHAVGGVVLAGGCGRGDAVTAPGSTSSTSAAPLPSSTIPPITETTTVASVTVEPTPWAGADFGALDSFLFATNTEAFAIVEGGSTVHEWYRTDSAYRRDVASAQKSVLSLMVGRAIGDGLVSFDTPIDRILGSGWTPREQTSTVTVGHLLTMTSGLDDGLASVAAPGTEWRYSGAFAVLFDVLKALTGREIDDLAGEWLFDPVGATGAAFYPRPAGAFASIGLFAGVSDLIAIGESVLNETQPGLPTDWIDRSLRSSQSFNPAYGYLWWLNGQTSYLLPGPGGIVRDGPLIPPAPSSVVAALGKDDQKLYVSRSLSLVVARLGGKADPAAPLALTSFDADLWALLGQLR